LTNVSPNCHRDSLFAYNDELIEFYPDAPPADFRVADHTFGIVSRRERSDGVLDFRFAAERARYIQIYPKTGYSCFISGTIDSVSVLSSPVTDDPDQ
ncbi:MAG: hypothetical protein NT149_02340, partial [Candidatus Gottesmanbacteria bacterium]|nr:hypothetical protein [Candidatus Gottesmanbacteria bacterium]